MFELVNQFADHFGFMHAKCGAWLIHDQDTCFKQKRACNGDRLALTTRQGGYRGCEFLEVRVQPVQYFTLLMFHGGIIKETKLVDKFAPQKQVLRSIKVIGKGKVLIDRLDVIVTCITRIFNFGFLAVDDDLPGIGLIGP